MIIFFSLSSFFFRKFCTPLGDRGIGVFLDHFPVSTYLIELLFKGLGVGSIQLDPLTRYHASWRVAKINLWFPHNDLNFKKILNGCAHFTRDISSTDMDRVFLDSVSHEDRGWPGEKNTGTAGTGGTGQHLIPAGSKSATTKHFLLGFCAN